MHVFMLALIVLDDRYTLPSLASGQCTRDYVHDVHELRFLVQLKQSILSIPSCRFQTSHTSKYEFRCKRRLCLRLSSWTQSG